MNLIEFVNFAKNKLENSNAFAEDFVNLRIECYRTYQNGLIQSGSHGIEFFDNVIKYYNDPESYPLPKDKKGAEYEINFIKFLQLNK